MVSHDKALIERIERQALAEKAAAATKAEADVKQRQEWWATTLMLAEAKTKADIGAAYDVVERVLGQSRTYLGQRRATGLAFAMLEHGDITPRKAMEAVRAGADITPELVERIRQSEADGESLREFAASLTGKQWSVGSPEVIVKAVTENPEIAKAIAADPDAHLAVERERNMAADATPRAPKAKDEPPMGLPELLLIGVIAADAQKVVTALTAVNTEGRAFTDEARTIVNGYADEAIALLQNAKAIVNGEVRTHLTDADFDALLTGGER